MTDFFRSFYRFRVRESATWLHFMRSGPETRWKRRPRSASSEDGPRVGKERVDVADSIGRAGMPRWRNGKRFDRRRRQWQVAEGTTTQIRGWQSFLHVCFYDTRTILCFSASLVFAGGIMASRDGGRYFILGLFLGMNRASELACVYQLQLCPIILHHAAWTSWFLWIVQWLFFVISAEVGGMAWGGGEAGAGDHSSLDGEVGMRRACICRGALAMEDTISRMDMDRDLHADSILRLQA